MTRIDNLGHAINGNKIGKYGISTNSGYLEATWIKGYWYSNYNTIIPASSLIGATIAKNLSHELLEYSTPPVWPSMNMKGLPWFPRVTGYHKLIINGEPVMCLWRSGNTYNSGRWIFKSKSYSYSNIVNKFNTSYISPYFKQEDLDLVTTSVIKDVNKVAVFFSADLAFKLNQLVEETGSDVDTIIRVLLAVNKGKIASTASTNKLNTPSREIIRIGLEDTLRFGKYQGMSLDRAIRVDPEYVRWLINPSSCPHLPRIWIKEDAYKLLNKIEYNLGV